MNVYRIALVVWMLVLLMGCASSPSPTSRTDGIDIGGTLLVEAWASADCVKLGQTVHLRTTVTNKGARHQVIELNEKPVLDIVIGNPEKSEKRWSAGRVLTPDQKRLDLAPGESKSIEMDWVAERMPYGVATVWGIFNYDNKGNYKAPLVDIWIESCPGGIGH